ncbi:hypothetical protein [Anaplasma platys]|nr:hypothetical protein [Anaplasma platys]
MWVRAHGKKIVVAKAAANRRREFGCHSSYGVSDIFTSDGH